MFQYLRKPLLAACIAGLFACAADARTAPTTVSTDNDPLHDDAFTICTPVTTGSGIITGTLGKMLNIPKTVKINDVGFLFNALGMDAIQPPFLADVAKIDASWAQSKQFYIGENGTGNAIKTRYPDFKKWLSEHPDTPIIMPNVSWSESFKQIQFGNGRHRFAVFRDMGFKKLWVSIPKKPT